MDTKYINKNYLEESIKDYDNTIIEPIRTVVSNIYYNTANEFNSINNTFNSVNAISNDRYKDLINALNISIPGGIGLDLQLNYINSTSPVNYRAARNIIFTTGQIGNIWCDTPDKVGTQYYDWNAATNTLIFSSLTSTITANANMDNMFALCSNAYFIGNILIPNNIATMVNTFYDCFHFNQNILIPNSVTDLNNTFRYCTNLNQNILIPNSVTGLHSTFESCYNLNQNIFIPNSVTSLASTFKECTRLNQNILIPNSVTTMTYAFARCSNLNQNILIPNSVIQLHYAFQGCRNLNQNIYLYSEMNESVIYMSGAFNGCTLLSDKYIHIRSSIPMDTSNAIYNSLVNNYTGINWTGRVINDLEEPTQWPPV